MKNLSFVVIAIFGVLSCNAQILNSIPTQQVKINNKITLGSSPTELTTLFANPNNPYQITNGFWEMQNANVKNYIFDGATFTYLDNKLADFEITSSNYYIQTDVGSIRVGNNISTLKTSFPASYGYKADGNFSINIGTGDYQFILIEYNQNNIITCIDTRFY